MSDLHNREDLPLVSIVMAVYHPREDWLIEQLASLNRQTYPKLALFICDDGPDRPVNPVLFQTHITAFRWHLACNQQNKGSNKTFERLTAMADGKYIAYCDQDDIWEDNKIELLVERLEKTNAELCCSDLSVINENGEIIANSITKVRKRHVFLEGANLAPKLLVRNFVTGCAIIMKTETAKAAIPFEEYMVHDHWLAFFAALKGEIAFEPTPTVRYRQHNENQTSVLAGINAKKDYYKLRIELLNKRISSLQNRIEVDRELKDKMEQARNWVVARQNYFYHPSFKNAKEIWRHKEFGQATSLFELFMPFIPRVLFGRVINFLRQSR